MNNGAPLAQVFAAADADVALGRTSPDLVSVPLDTIVPCRWQPRQVFEAGALLDLAKDIEQHGVLTPPLVWMNEDGEWELIAGERRIRACYALCLHAAGKINPLEKAVAHVAEQGFGGLARELRRDIRDSMLPAVLAVATVQCREVWGSVAQLHELALVDNLQRADLTALEEARALQDLIREYGYTQRDLGQRLGKSQTWVSQRLTLLHLAPEIAERVASGEIEPATAREIARLDPAVQPEAVAHLQGRGIKSKAAANLVGNILELSDPEAWASDGGLYHAHDVVIQDKLSNAAPAERQRALLKMAAGDSNGRLARPRDSYAYDRLLVAVGAAATPYQAMQAAYAATAVNLGRTCETCQLNAHRPQIVEVQELRRAAGNRDEKAALSWPHCGMGETRTCPAHRLADERLSLHVPSDSRYQRSPEEDERIVKSADGWYHTTEDFATWYTVCSRQYRAAIAEVAARQDQKGNGVARALAGYIAEQHHVATNHIYSQPCANCAFHKRDAEDPLKSCAFQAQPPELAWGQETLAATWQAEGVEGLVGRCKLFRLQQIGLLPDLPDKAEINRAGIMHLLHHLSGPADYAGTHRSGPRWLDVHRPKAYNPPPWGECETALKKLIPLLTPGQLYALLVAWNEVLDPGAADATQEIYDPHANSRRTFRRVARFEVQR